MQTLTQLLDLHPSVVIWTTTPWTIPANRAVSFNTDIAIRPLYKCTELEADLPFEPWIKPGDHITGAGGPFGSKIRADGG